MNAQIHKKKNAILPYLGGKSKLAPQIVELINQREHKCYVEVFCGAAHVFNTKNPSDTEVLNDINGELVNLYRVVQSHLEEFLRSYRYALISRAEFMRQKVVDPKTLTDIQRANRYFYLQKLGFGGRFDGSFGTSTTGKPRLNLFRIEEVLSEWHVRLVQVAIENLDWRKVVEKYDRPHTLFYLDPPYFGCENDYGKGIFDRADFAEMAEMLWRLKGDFIVSINDTPEIRQIFKGFQMQEVELKYSISKGATTKAKELLITPSKTT